LPRAPGEGLEQQQFEHGIQSQRDVIVPDAYHAIAALSQFDVALTIGLAVRVLAAVDLDHSLASRERKST
jgi:hypothetical protein